MHSSSRPIFTAFHAIGPILRPLRFPLLHPTQRRVLGGRIFGEGPLVVDQVAEALTQNPHLFPDAPEAGPALAERQARADHYCALRDLLLIYAQMAGDGYLDEQSTAITHAMTLIRQVQAEALLPTFASHPLLQERQDALGPSILLLAQKRLRLQLKRRKPSAAPMTQDQLQTFKSQLEADFRSLLQQPAAGSGD